MEKETKFYLFKIILSATFLVIAVIIEKNCNLPLWGNLLVYLVPYLIAGYEVLKEATESIIHGEFL